MLSPNRTYIAIDLKSFFASVECVERGLNPLTTNLVVADASRTEKTICLAVSPALKVYGIPGRPRLFEVVQKVKEANTLRRYHAPQQKLHSASFDEKELKTDSSLAISYITAPPRMAHYIKYSTKIYNIYLKYIAPEDIHIYSIDEVFMDVTNYLTTYHLTAYELAMKIIHDVLKSTGITATAGIGTNLYLCKIAMDIVAKHLPPDKDGVRIAVLNEQTYRHTLWSHRPLTDFWRVGKGYARKLEAHQLFTMGDIARCSLGKKTDYYNEDFLYKLLGINAELLIDHAWGWEPCTIADIKAYKPDTKSISSGQVLHCAYTSDNARLIVREMADLLVLDLVDKALMTDKLVLTVGYDTDNLSNPSIINSYTGEISTDNYNRKIPKPAHGTISLDCYTSSARLITDAFMELYDRIINPILLVRRITITANNIISEAEYSKKNACEQFDLFTDYTNKKKESMTDSNLEREKKMQQTLLSIKKKFGKNAILKGMNLENGAMTIKRNSQIGGHKA